ncbi:cytochrome-c oxidase [Brevibacillus ginsengisoli]|uniref:cytochrome-c oxidase n=1 Tax=Brevibacillus ginsengisoli TaxID=363854 RepID=UPI003CEDAA71
MKMGIKFIKISVVYFLIGIIMGMFMSITHKIQFAPSHAHINLLGWTSLALAGVIYTLFPRLGLTGLGKWHFWLHNLGLPVMMIGLLVLEAGNPAIEPVIAIGASALSIGVLLFVINVIGNLKGSVVSGADSSKEQYKA